MATLTTNPIVLLAADAGSVVSAGPMTIKAIEFQGTTDDDAIAFHDIVSGNLVWQAKLGTVATSGYNASFRPAESVHVKSLYLTTMDNGTALIYV